MRLYLLRHGKAESRAAWSGDDGLRPLTADGEAAMRREAAALKRLGVQPTVIVTSPLERARRTAEIVAEALGLSDAVVEDERLAHGFDARGLATIVAGLEPAGAIMAVGHEPEFSAVVAELIGGGAVVMKKGGLARVDVADETLRGGELVWLLTPATLDGE
jgi:phosphohistidine phosphatase